MVPLEVEEERQVPVKPTERDEMQQGEDVPLPPTGVNVEPSSSSSSSSSSSGKGGIVGTSSSEDTKSITS
jgi:hypothetical protein